ncbi:MAG: 50S ribosomal protein L15 [Gammaproteobacteria bacterium]
MSELSLNTLKPAPGSRPKKKRLGRGIGSTLGKTCGKGHKGLKARSGGTVKAGFQGGQTPLYRSIPKSGFNSRKQLQKQQVRVGLLGQVEGGIITIDTLKAAGIINQNIKYAKIFASGELNTVVTVKGIPVSKGARDIIIKAGGNIEE